MFDRTVFILVATSTSYIYFIFHFRNEHKPQNCGASWLFPFAFDWQVEHAGDAGLGVKCKPMHSVLTPGNSLHTHIPTSVYYRFEFTCECGFIFVSTREDRHTWHVLRLISECSLSSRWGHIRHKLALVTTTQSGAQRAIKVKLCTHQGGVVT